MAAAAPDALGQDPMGTIAGSCYCPPSAVGNGDVASRTALTGRAANGYTCHETTGRRATTVAATAAHTLGKDGAGIHLGSGERAAVSDRDLVAISQRHAVTSVMVEKAVDVKIAIDMVVMAERGEYDTAYLLSADGDLTPAVAAVRASGRKVFVASAQSGAQLAAACDRFLPLRREWFDGLFGFTPASEAP